MSDRSTPASEQPVAEELAALRRELATVHARLDRVTRRPVRRRRLTRLLPLGIVALLVSLMPLSVLAVNPFLDLTGGPHDNNIDLIFNAGITTGCDPTHYCPTGNVTREEMASFLARTAGLGPLNKPVANAARLAATNPTAGGPTYAANELVRVARNSRDTGTPTVISAQTWTELIELQITAPGAGFVFAVGSVEFFNPAAARCTGAMRLRSGAVNSPETFTTLEPTASTYNTVTQTYVFPVVAGAQTVVLEVERYNTPNNACSVNAFDPTITALYVPFGSTGAAALDTPNASGGGQVEPQGRP